ncbi:MAG TPA: class I SAM-dependent methyltransferase [Bdellovibrionales bacterium]|nr:class I SAM-dependent methyltransferase [Bdellovibrionales bacterium]
MEPERQTRVICTLCGSGAAKPIEPPAYFHCRDCDLRFLDPVRHLTPDLEKPRYEMHENKYEDPAYRRFLSAISSPLLERLPQGSLGLDFGSGPSPVLARILTEGGLPTEVYDPYFANDADKLKTRYDFVVSSEAIEHFYRPGEEFKKLKNLVKPGGLLAVMTHIYQDGIDFQDWYYRRDPTHVAFYSAKTLAWICEGFGFATLEILGPRVALFCAPRPANV